MDPQETHLPRTQDSATWPRAVQQIGRTALTFPTLEAATAAADHHVTLMAIAQGPDDRYWLITPRQAWTLQCCGLPIVY